MTGSTLDESSTDAAPVTRRPRRVALALGAVGIVYGDIGTSPIYALREALRALGGGPPSADEVIGLLSLIVWSLVLIVTLKYVAIVTRADNHGEGGSLSLMTLASAGAGRWAPAVRIVGMIGACLFVGDAAITPAISVLSAVEGVGALVPALEGHVVDLTVAILVALFAAQRFGTGRVATVFGPLTALWLLAIAAAGIAQLPSHPEVLLALDPSHALGFLVHHSGIALVVAGAIFLAVTGAEALYADLGHFGREPIALAWFALVFPCLLASYFGQGAYVLEHGFDGRAMLFDMVPGVAGIALAALATVATVIASQAVISGLFSLVAQAVQLGLLPRQRVRHTSESEFGQVYVPFANVALMLAVIALVLAFGSSERLAAAYGIAVAGDMLMTTLMLGVVIRRVWGRPLWQALALTVPLGLIECAFLVANGAKIPDGAWVSIVIGGAVLVLMLVWVRGREVLEARLRRDALPTRAFVESLARHPPATVPGLGVFLAADIERVPTSLLHSLKHFKVLHERVVLLHVRTEPRPRVATEQRVELERLGERFALVTLHYGYMERPDVAHALATCHPFGRPFDIMSTTFVLSRRALRARPRTGLARGWNVIDALFALMAQNASDTTRYFRIPTSRVVELGAQVRL